MRSITIIAITAVGGKNSRTIMILGIIYTSSFAVIIIIIHNIGVVARRTDDGRGRQQQLMTPRV